MKKGSVIWSGLPTTGWREELLQTKIVLGIPFYGCGFTLSNSNQHGYNALSSGSSFEGAFTREPGYLAYYEICNQKGTRVWGDEWKMSHAYSSDQWVRYNDQPSLAMKVQWMHQQNFGGCMDDLEPQSGWFQQHAVWERQILSSVCA